MPVASAVRTNPLKMPTILAAASIVGIFNGLVRTADATGIPLDDSMKLATVDAREDLGINEFMGALNTL